MRILIVDDRVTLRELWKRGLEKAGHTVVGTAKNGIEALEQFRTLRPDITIMDHEMPELKGLDALRRIRGEFPNAVVIMCASHDLNLLARSLGAKAFVPKPLFVGDLLRAVQSVLKED